jgi:hypothetical protein
MVLSHQGFVRPVDDLGRGLLVYLEDVVVIFHARGWCGLGQMQAKRIFTPRYYRKKNRLESRGFEPENKRPRQKWQGPFTV